MTTLEIILTALSSIFAVAVGGGGILFYRQNNRLKKLEGDEKTITNDNMVSDGWQEYAAEMKEMRDKYESKYEKTYKDYMEQVKKNTDLECENTKLKMTHCEVPNCPTRKPPTGY